MTIMGREITDWSDWLPWIKGVLGSIGGVLTVILGVRKLRQEALSAVEAEDDRRKRREIEVTLRVLDDPAVKERIVAVLLTSSTFGSHVDTSVKNAVALELIDNPAMTELQQAVFSVYEGLRNIERIFIQAGADSRFGHSNPNSNDGPDTGDRYTDRVEIKKQKQK